MELSEIVTAFHVPLPLTVSLTGPRGGSHLRSPSCDNPQEPGVCFCRLHLAVNYIFFSASCLTAKIIPAIRSDRGHMVTCRCAAGSRGSGRARSSGPSALTCVLQGVPRAGVLGAGKSRLEAHQSPGGRGQLPHGALNRLKMLAKPYPLIALWGKMQNPSP